MIRPKISDEDVIALALDALLPRVMEWLSQDGSASSAEEVRADLAQHIDSDNGFEFCYNKALSQQAKKWIAAYRIFPGHAVGDTVQFGQHSCEITKVDNEEGRYWLFSPEEGHVREGLGTHAHIVDWEKIDGRVNARGTQAMRVFLESLVGRKMLILSGRHISISLYEDALVTALRNGTGNEITIAFAANAAPDARDHYRR